MFIFIILVLISVTNCDSYLLFSNCNEEPSTTYNISVPFKQCFQLLDINKIDGICYSNLINTTATTPEDIWCPGCSPNQANITNSIMLELDPLDSNNYLEVIYTQPNCSGTSTKITIFSGLCEQCELNGSPAKFNVEIILPSNDSASDNPPTTSSSADNSNNDTGVIAGVTGGVGFVLIIIAAILCCGIIIVLICLGCLCLILSIASVCIIIIIGVVSLLAGSVGGWTVYRKTKNSKSVELSDLILHERIGGGAQGQVFRATWKDTEVAVKKINILESIVTTVIDEITIMETFDNPYILPILGHVFQGTDVYVILPLCKSSLEHLVMKDKSLSLKSKVKYLYQASLGIQYLHKNKLIHRDIAARNILINMQDVAVVTDFGLSRFVNHDDPEQVSTTKSNISPVRSSAPETLQDQVYSYATDCYSFGSLIYETLTGLRPYNDIINPMTVLKMVMDGQRPDLNHSNISSRMANLLKMTWLERYQDRVNIDYIVNCLLEYHNDLENNSSNSIDENTDENDDTSIPYTSSSDQNDNPVNINNFSKPTLTQNPPPPPSNINYVNCNNNNIDNSNNGSSTQVYIGVNTSVNSEFV